jgi:hypothetical protein
MACWRGRREKAEKTVAAALVGHKSSLTCLLQGKFAGLLSQPFF